MSRYGMRKPIGRRLTEPGSGRYIDGRRPRPSRRPVLPYDSPKHEPTCGNDDCWCWHTDHAAACDPHGCLPF